MVLTPALALWHLSRKEALPDMVGHESEDEEKYHHKFSVENDEAKFPILAQAWLGIAHLKHAWVGQHSEAPRMTEQIDHVKKVDQRLEAFRASGSRDHKLVGHLFFIFKLCNSLIEVENLIFRSIIVDGKLVIHLTSLELLLNFFELSGSVGNHHSQTYKQSEQNYETGVDECIHSQIILHLLCRRRQSVEPLRKPILVSCVRLLQKVVYA